MLVSRNFLVPTEFVDHKIKMFVCLYFSFRHSLLYHQSREVIAAESHNSVPCGSPVRDVLIHMHGAIKIQQPYERCWALTVQVMTLENLSLELIKHERFFFFFLKLCCRRFTPTAKTLERVFVSTHRYLRLDIMSCRKGGDDER